MSDPNRGSDASQRELTVGDLAAGTFCLAKTEDGVLCLEAATTVWRQRHWPVCDLHYHWLQREARQWFNEPGTVILTTGQVAELHRTIEVEQSRRKVVEQEFSFVTARALEDDAVVYFVQREFGGRPSWVKIGYTAWLDSRLALLRKEVGRLRLLGLTRGGPALEAELHRRFAMARKRGEWFAPVQPLLDLAASSRYVPARAHGKKWRSIADGWF